ncbi:hypothetical protein BAE44_0017587 [Dichanthelium oligosanthes]|uniref:VQ domain-containing protein n=1 Tax=Dichanthelium oligosanthes TaxID=888268 RepID=A0A1E5V8P6_9POAL|nr:hypothetical protein BAE44_0017587 [Dichanthelium oligosanthes]
MDSGNSSSLQSSSGGDDDFDAACGKGADSSSPLSVLLRQPGFGGNSSLIYGLQDLGTPPLSHWCSTMAPLPPAGTGGSASLPSLPCHGGPAASGAAEQTAAATAAQPAVRPQGSRKRARASRRAPTTVLTTDTSNFRAMVQDFTGIPAPPFASPSAVRSGRFDHIFPSRSSPSAAAALPQYLLCPFVHKLHAYPFTSPSMSSMANVAIVAPIASTAATAPAAPRARTPPARGTSPPPSRWPPPP